MNLGEREHASPVQRDELPGLKEVKQLMIVMSVRNFTSKVAKQLNHHNIKE